MQLTTGPKPSNLQASQKREPQKPARQAGANPARKPEADRTPEATPRPKYQLPKQENPSEVAEEATLV